MRIDYEVPQHLEKYLEDMNDAGIQNLFTLILEHAVNHKMLDYPKTEVEFNLCNVLRSVKRIESKQVSETAMVMSTLAEILDRLGNIEDNPIKEIVTIRETAPVRNKMKFISKINKENNTNKHIKMEEENNLIIEEEDDLSVEELSFMSLISS